MSDTPSLDANCGRYFCYRDFIECGDTFKALRPDNFPKSEQTYLALEALAREVLDPAIEEFGPIHLTYGLSCNALSLKIKLRISPPHDQHASYELNSRGKQICPRGGAAVDFVCENKSSLVIAKWIAENCVFDRLYYYGDDRPIHVSTGPEENRLIVLIQKSRIPKRRIPRKITVEKFCELDIDDELITKCSNLWSVGS